PGVVVRLVVVDGDARLLGELLDEVVAERRHRIVLEAADRDRAAGRSHDARGEDPAAGDERRAGKASLQHVAPAEGPFQQLVDGFGLVAHLTPPCLMWAKWIVSGWSEVVANAVFSATPVLSSKRCRCRAVGRTPQGVPIGSEKSAGCRMLTRASPRLTVTSVSLPSGSTT